MQMGRGMDRQIKANTHKNRRADDNQQPKDGKNAMEATAERQPLIRHSMAGSAYTHLPTPPLPPTCALNQPTTDYEPVQQSAQAAPAGPCRRSTEPRRHGDGLYGASWTEHATDHAAFLLSMPYCFKACSRWSNNSRLFRLFCRILPVNAAKALQSDGVLLDIMASSFSCPADAIMSLCRVVRLKLRRKSSLPSLTIAQSNKTWGLLRICVYVCM